MDESELFDDDKKREGLEKRLMLWRNQCRPYRQTLKPVEFDFQSADELEKDEGKPRPKARPELTAWRPIAKVGSPVTIKMARRR